MEEAATGGSSFGLSTLRPSWTSRLRAFGGFRPLTIGGMSSRYSRSKASAGGAGIEGDRHRA